MKTLVLESTEIHYDEFSAEKEVLDTITKEYPDAIITSKTPKGYYCEECRDTHYYCTVVFNTNRIADNSFAIKLQKALNK